MTVDQLDELLTAGQRRAELTVAAIALAVRRHGERQGNGGPKIWTGYIEPGRRAFRGQRVILADGNLGYIFGIQRGRAAVWTDAPHVVGEERYMVVDVADLKRYRLPSAVRLGAQKKGVIEAPSERKRASSRKNGRQPCAPGRRRGRPRKVVHAATPEPAPTGPRPRDVGGWLPRMSFHEAMAYFSKPQGH